MTACPECNGQGKIPFSGSVRGVHFNSPVFCFTCGGKGHIEQTPDNGKEAGRMNSRIPEKYG